MNIYSFKKNIFKERYFGNQELLENISWISWYSQIYSVVEGRYYIKFSQFYLFHLFYLFHKVFISVKFHCIAKGLTSILDLNIGVLTVPPPMSKSSACVYSINYVLKILENDIFVKCTQNFLLSKITNRDSKVDLWVKALFFALWQPELNFQNLNSGKRELILVSCVLTVKRMCIIMHTSKNNNVTGEIHNKNYYIATFTLY